VENILKLLQYISGPVKCPPTRSGVKTPKDMPDNEQYVFSTQFNDVTANWNFYFLEIRESFVTRQFSTSHAEN